MLGSVTFSWIGGSSGDWSNPASWADLTSGDTPSVVVPGSLDVVIIGSAGTAVSVSGKGSAADLTAQGSDVVLGTLNVGTLAVGSGASLSFGPDATAFANTAEVAGTIEFDGNDDLNVAFGTLTIDPGGTLTGTGEFRGDLVLNGRIESSNFWIGVPFIASNGYGPFLSSFAVFDDMSGSGTVEVPTGGTIGLLNTIATAGLSFVLDGTADLDIAAAIAAGNTIALTGAGNTLTVDDRWQVVEHPASVFGGNSYSTGGPPTVGAAITGFDSSDTITVIESFGLGTTLTSAEYSGGTLNLLSNDSIVSSLSLVGDYTGETFMVGAPVASPSGHSQEITIACFAAGTRIATPAGEVPVERLRAGDLVCTVSGNAEPIRWIGHRHIAMRRHTAPEQVRPVRIAPHAFGQNLPRRALLLSPDHAVFVEDVLVPVKYLVNGTTVAQTRPARIDYYHIELARHHVVLAEGLPAESYLETGGRANFENDGGIVRLHPDFSPDPGRFIAIWEAAGYAPLAIAGSTVDRVRTRLAVQAAMLGHSAGKRVLCATRRSHRRG
jgi:hypothetical protein